MIERKTSDHLHQGAQDAPEAWNMLKADQDNMAAETRPLQCFLVEDSGLILRGLIDTLQEMLPLRVVWVARVTKPARRSGSSARVETSI